MTQVIYQPKASDPFIDTTRATFFTLYEVGVRPALSEHPSLTAAGIKASRLCRETGKHYCIGFEDSNIAVRFVRPISGGGHGCVVNRKL